MQTHWFADGLALYNYDCREVLPVLGDASVDSVVTDPPYEIGFMGKSWDAGGAAYDVGTWKECFRVLKPGGYLVAFGGTRTYHRLANAIEDAGFEIRDSLHWLYGSGFPKSLDVSKAIDKAAGAEREVVGTRPQFPDGTRGARARPNASPEVYGDRLGLPGEIPVTAPATPDAARWEGWGTALKPAHEPIVLARKPLAGTVAQNVLTHGTGALNVDGCRVDGAGAESGRVRHGGGSNGVYAQDEWTQANQATMGSAMPAGRWPPNVLLTHAADCDGQCAPGCPVAGLDGQSGDRPGFSSQRDMTDSSGTKTAYGANMKVIKAGSQREGYNDSGGASRFFPQLNWSPEYDLPFLYQAKASAKERPRHADGSAHPTVKPLALMRWLARLVTPPGGTILDPFCGTGTTLQAARLEGFRSIGCDSWDQAAEMACQRLGLVVEADAG